MYFDALHKVMFSFHPVTLEAKIEYEGEAGATGASQEALALR